MVGNLVVLPDYIINKIFNFLENDIKLSELIKIDTINFVLMPLNYTILQIDSTSVVNLIHTKKNI